MKGRILVVEDDAAIADGLSYSLGAAGYDVETASDGANVPIATVDGYDVLIVDVMLPTVSGLELCRRVRARSDVPVLILTAMTDVVDRVLGLDAGADDYIPKPFSMAELESRVRAILRRRRLDLDSGTRTKRVGDLELDLIDQSVHLDGKAIELTQSEFRLLALLAEKPEYAFTRTEIIRALTRSEFVGDERLCDTHVKNLRRKLERDCRRPRYLVTVRGVGYMLRAA
jgi:DNA-binding response OmpR family regulator